MFTSVSNCCAACFCGRKGFNFGVALKPRVAVSGRAETAWSDTSRSAVNARSWANFFGPSCPQASSPKRVLIVVYADAEEAPTSLMLPNSLTLPGPSLWNILQALFSLNYLDFFTGIYVLPLRKTVDHTLKMLWTESAHHICKVDEVAVNGMKCAFVFLRGMSPAKLHSCFVRSHFASLPMLILLRFNRRDRFFNAWITWSCDLRKFLFLCRARNLFGSRTSKLLVKRLKILFRLKCRSIASRCVPKISQALARLLGSTMVTVNAALYMLWNSVTLKKKKQYN